MIRGEHWFFIHYYNKRTPLTGAADEGRLGRSVKSRIAQVN